MTLRTDNNAFVTQEADFASATQSNSINLSGRSLVGLLLPASFGQTSISFLSTLDDKTFYPIKDEAGTLITVTVDSTSASHVDLTNIFPASLGTLVRLVVSGAITKQVLTIERN